MCRQYYCHVQVRYKLCSSHFLVLSRSNSSHVQCAGHILVMCKSNSSHVQVKFYSCALCSVVKFQSCKLYNVQVIFQSCASQILVMCRSDSSHQSCAGQILVMCIVHCAVWSNSSHVHCTTCRSYSSHVKVKFQSCAGQILVQCALREGHFHFNLHVSFYAVVVEKPKMKIISFQN